jgi:hypothetical protein
MGGELNLPGLQNSVPDRGDRIGEFGFHMLLIKWSFYTTV